MFEPQIKLSFFLSRRTSADAFFEIVVPLSFVATLTELPSHTTSFDLLALHPEASWCGVFGATKIADARSSSPPSAAAAEKAATPALLERTLLLALSFEATFKHAAGYIAASRSTLAEAKRIVELEQKYVKKWTDFMAAARSALNDKLTQAYERLGQQEAGTEESSAAAAAEDWVDNIFSKTESAAEQMHSVLLHQLHEELSSRPMGSQPLTSKSWTLQTLRTYVADDRLSHIVAEEKASLSPWDNLVGMLLISRALGIKNMAHLLVQMIQANRLLFRNCKEWTSPILASDYAALFGSSQDEEDLSEDILAASDRRISGAATQQRLRLNQLISKFKSLQTGRENFQAEDGSDEDTDADAGEDSDVDGEAESQVDRDGGATAAALSAPIAATKSPHT